MKASELRIGNLILQGSRVKKVETLNLQFDDHIRVNDHHFNGEYISNNEDIEPIKLTEEWLLKFGFEKTDTSDYFNAQFTKGHLFTLKDVQIIIFGETYSYSYKQYDGGTSEDWNHCAELKYVHDLQNLYFVLNKEELKTND